MLINSRIWRRIPEKLQQIIEARLNEAGEAQRKDLTNLDQSYGDAMTKAGMLFNDVDANSFVTSSEVPDTMPASAAPSVIRRSSCWKRPRVDHWADRCRLRRLPRD